MVDRVVTDTFIFDDPSEVCSLFKIIRKVVFFWFKCV